MAVSVELYEEALPFAREVGDWLSAHPVTSTVLSTVLELEADGAGRERARREGYPYWFMLARGSDGQVEGVGMRTAPFEGHPAYLLPLPGAAAVELARLLHARGERLDGVNGALPAARSVAEETARLTGRSVTVGMHTRLFELAELADAPRTDGRLRAATAADVDLAVAWFAAFHVAADEQAGRPAGQPTGAGGPEAGRDEVVARVRDGRIWLWEDASGTPVHLTGTNPPAVGVVRVGPVYTPSEHRGRGYAGAAVHEVSRRIRAEGHRACLFTDQANPTSNRLYEALGYRAVVDMTNLLIVPGGA